MSAHEGQEFPIIVWRVWAEEIIPYLRGSGSMLLQAVLNFRQISRYYFREVDKYINELIDDNGAESSFDRILWAHIIYGTSEELRKFILKHKLSVEYLARLRPVKIHNQQHRTEEYRFDLIRWLINFGLDASGAIISNWHIEYLSLEWNVYLLEHGARCNFDDPTVFKSLDQLTRIWKFSDTNNMELISKLVSGLFRHPSYQKVNTAERKNLIMTANGSTSSDNVFKMLPVEIIEKIFSEVFEDNLWLEIADHLLKDVPDNSLDLTIVTKANYATMPKFFMKYWSKFSEKTKTWAMQMTLSLGGERTDTFRVQGIPDLEEADDEFYDSLLKFLQCPLMPSLFPPIAQDKTVVPMILFHAIHSPHPRALDLLKVLVQIQKCKPSMYVSSSIVKYPAVWFAMIHNNRKTIEYLIDNGSFPTRTYFDTYEIFARSRNVSEETLQFTTNYLRRKGLIDDEYDVPDLVENFEFEHVD